MHGVTNLTLKEFMSQETLSKIVAKGESKRDLYFYFNSSWKLAHLSKTIYLNEVIAWIDPIRNIIRFFKSHRCEKIGPLYKTQTANTHFAEKMKAKNSKQLFDLEK